MYVWGKITSPTYDTCAISWSKVDIYSYLKFVNGKSWKALCSRNFQNVKLRLNFVEIWSFYHHSVFMWNQILANSNGPKMLFFGNFRGSEFWFLVNLTNVQVPNLPKFKFSISKIAINDSFGPFEFAKMWLHAKIGVAIKLSNFNKVKP